LIRHTTPLVKPGTCYGRLDVPLAASQDADIAAVLARIAQKLPIEAVWTSPSARCRELALALTRATSAPLVEVPRLQELDFGAWEGMRWDDIDRAVSDVWAEDYWNRAPPGGESYSALAGRVFEVIEEAVRIGMSRLALVTHAGPIRAVLGRCLDLPPDRHAELGVAFGEVFEISIANGAWRKGELNV